MANASSHTAATAKTATLAPSEQSNPKITPAIKRLQQAPNGRFTNIAIHLTLSLVNYILLYFFYLKKSTQQGRKWEFKENT
jgi:hypothetical protein